MDTNKFVRKQFAIDAIRVTSSNIEKVSEWCNGSIESNPQGKFIRVDVHHPLTPRQTMAFIGDWVLASKRGFKVYTDSAFRTNFVTEKGSEIEMEMNDFVEKAENVVAKAANIFEMASELHDVLKEKVQHSGETTNVFDEPQELRMNEFPVVDAKDAISGKNRN